MNAKEIEIIKRHMEQAEKDLKACGRGSNYGRFNALKALMEELKIS